MLKFKKSKIFLFRHALLIVALIVLLVSGYYYFIKNGIREGVETKCSDVKNGILKISNEVKTTPSYKGCRDLKKLIIPKNIETIGVGAFADCSYLKFVIFEKGSKLKKIVGNNIEEVNIDWRGELKINSNDKGAFNSCGELISIKLDNLNELTEIGNSAFVFCGKNKSITIPKSVTKIGMCAFSWNFEAKSITFKKGSALTHIGAYAFTQCGFESITIPSSVTNIDKYAFYQCDKLTSVKFQPNSKLIGIKPFTFSLCTELTSITIPSSVTYIDDNAFGGCEALTSVTFETQSKLTKIGKLVFQDCTDYNKADGQYDERTTYKNCDKIKTVYNLPKDEFKSRFGNNVQFLTSTVGGPSGLQNQLR